MLKSLRDDNAGSKRMYISHLDPVRLYMKTMNKLSNVIEELSAIVKTELRQLGSTGRISLPA